CTRTVRDATYESAFLHLAESWQNQCQEERQCQGRLEPTNMHPFFHVLPPNSCGTSYVSVTLLLNRESPSPMRTGREKKVRVIVTSLPENQPSCRSGEK